MIPPDAIPNTPILCSGVLPSRIRAKQILSSLVGFLIGVGAGLPLIALDTAAVDRMNGQTLLVSWISVSFLAIVLHELGHLTAGWAVGFHFSSIQIGPLSLRIQYGVLRVRFVSGQGALGYAGMHVNRVLRLRRRLLIYVAGGPTANLLSAVVMILMLNNAFSVLRPTWVAVFAVQFAYISVAFAVLSLWPFWSSSRSDGARIAMLFRSRTRARRWLSIVAVRYLQNSGTRPRQWKSTWLKSATLPDDRRFDAFLGNWISYISANDRKDANVAGHHLEKCLELASTLPNSTRDTLAQESAVFAAWFLKDAPLSEKWHGQLRKPKQLNRLLQIRVQIAMLCARGNFDAAVSTWQEGAKFIDQATSGASRDRLRESFAEWREEIETRKNRQSEPSAQPIVTAKQTETELAQENELA